ncbi:hypothetical protein FHS33_006062 [Streptomyces calvus]|uniref:Uncharacterized protein n=2 Tax=Streptomyces calvus TaxID=67282 RepID=A0AA40SJE2_9ACTN|nr:hypothetical protein [Streptomyces calvus]GGP79683.1 hypothetical protein GCM10010247_61320 [Streptomyces calvus]
MGPDRSRNRSGGAAAAAVYAVLGACAPAAGAAHAVTMPAHDTASGLAGLAGWLVLAVVTAGCAELLLARTAPPASRARRLRVTGLLASALFAQLLLLTVRFARGQADGAAWTAAGLTVALSTAATWRATRISHTYGNGHTPSDSGRTRAAFGVAVVCGGWLTVRSAVQGPLWLAWLMGALVVVVAAGFWMLDGRGAMAEFDGFQVFGFAAALGVLGVAAGAIARLDGIVLLPVPHDLPWLSGRQVLRGLAGLAALVAAVVFLVGRRLRGRQWDGAAPPGAQLVGLAVPLGSLVWAGRDWSGWDSAPLVLLGASAVAAAAAVLLAVQAAALSWLDTTPSRPWVQHVLSTVREEAERHTPDPYERYGSPGTPDHRYGADDRYGRHRDDRYGRHRDDHAYLRARNRFMHSGDFPYGPRGRTGPLAVVLRVLAAAGRGLAHPLRSAAVTEVHRHTMGNTGLAIDEMWPRVAELASDTVRRRVRRTERAVLACRVTAASALCTAAVWLPVAALGADDAAAGGTPGVLLGTGASLGPLLLAAVAVAQGRRLLLDACRAKGDAVDVLRYDLARRMGLVLPKDTRGMILLAGPLSSDSSDRRPARLRQEWDGTAAAEAVKGLRAEVQALRSAVGEEVRSAVREEIGSAVRAEIRSAVREARTAPGAPAGSAAATPVTLDEQAVSRLMENMAGAAPVTLDEQTLARLARDVARNAAEPVRARLSSDLAQVQRSLREELGEVVRASVEATVTGPPLTNFTGYLAIELNRPLPDDQPPLRVENGTIKAVAGRPVHLLLHVVRKARAADAASLLNDDERQNLFLFEPVRIEGGRDAATAAFDAVVDSSTLTPVPHRKTLSVTRSDRSVFLFDVPARPGIHEVWFQLYQAGRLIQVAALKIEAEAETGTGTVAAPQASGPGGDTDHA